jgi:sulfite exporter TauE/SafE
MLRIDATCLSSFLTGGLPTKNLLTYSGFASKVRALMRQFRIRAARLLMVAECAVVRPLEKGVGEGIHPPCKS